MPRAKKKYNQMDHMVQLGKVGSLMQASIQLNKLILKEKRVLKQIEQLRLVKDIKNDQRSRHNKESNGGQQESFLERNETTER